MKHCLWESVTNIRLNETERSLPQGKRNWKQLLLVFSRSIHTKNICNWHKRFEWCILYTVYIMIYHIWHRHRHIILYGPMDQVHVKCYVVANIIWIMLLERPVTDAWWRATFSTDNSLTTVTILPNNPRTSIRLELSEKTKIYQKKN